MVGNEYKFLGAKDDITSNYYIANLLNKALPNSVNFKKVKCYALCKNNEPLVAWAFHDGKIYTDSDGEFKEGQVSIAAFDKKWRPFSTVRLILSLFFNDKGYNRLTAVTHINNRQAVRLVNFAGFTLEGIIRRPADIGNLMQFSLLKTDWEKGRFYG